MATVQTTATAPPAPAPAAAGVPWQKALRYLVVNLELALILRLVWSYSLEGRVFVKLAALLWAGFTVHCLLPARFRLPFFGVLSGIGILVILGPLPGAWLLALGLAVIGLCHLPVPFGVRLGAIGAAAAALLLARAGRLPVPWSTAIWPIFGSMFALRIVLYLYDLKHRSAPFSFWRSVGYFFMLPNVAFPLFPVVDYQTFCRTHENDADRIRGMQTGIDWMVRGTVHLVLYRLIYQRLPLDAASVTTVPLLLRYLLWPFLLYLNVSGLFHLVVGMLRLFGFNLPETHHLFYLAPSFTDFWRRINIYWKDFMMKVFYYPSFFRLRRFGNGVALVLGTFVVFFATWLLHSWQWFWLRGAFLLKANDALFWTVLALLVAGNVLLEANRPMARRLDAAQAPWSESVSRAFRALGVFAAICLLWSLWVSDSVSDWVSLFGVLRRATPRDLVVLPALLAFAGVFVGLAVAFERRRAAAFSFPRQALASGLVIVALSGAGATRFYRPYAGTVAEFFHQLKAPGLNSRDAARRQRDYYEKLNDVGWENPELAKVYMVKPPDWGFIRYRPDLATLKNGMPYLELLPNARGRHHGVEVRLNRWGMRDRDYPLERGAGVYRIALLGASEAFASGVPQEEGFEALVEERLNREGRLGAYRTVEILNFATEGYTALDVLAWTEKKVLAFQPHALLYTVHQIDPYRTVQQLARLVNERVPIPMPGLVAFARASGLTPGTNKLAAAQRLAPRQDELYAWACRGIAELTRRRGVRPVMAYMPILTPQTGDTPAETLLAIGREAGFLTLDLSGVYDGQDRGRLKVALWDDHPNSAGHRLVADRLYAALRGVESSLWGENDAGRDQGTDSQLHPQGVPAR